MPLIKVPSKSIMNAIRTIQNAKPDKNGMVTKKANNPNAARATDTQNVTTFGALNFILTSLLNQSSTFGWTTHCAYRHPSPWKPPD